MTIAQQNLIEFRGVSWRPNGGSEAAIIDDVSLEVPFGETLVLLGRSGSGKTTLLKLINGMHWPSIGEVLVEGRATREWDAIRLRRGIGYVIQEAGLFPHFTVAENVALVPGLENWPREKIAARVKEMLQLVGLEPEQFARRRPRERVTKSSPRSVRFRTPLSAQKNHAGKVGTGFDADTLAGLAAAFRSFRRNTPPFSNPPRDKNVTWLEPRLVAQIGFQEWTADLKLRQPVFLGLREDKEPREIQLPGS